MTDWSETTVGNCLEPLALQKTRKVLSRDYKSSGSFPIVDQGQRLIAGWTDDEAGLISTHLPVVVFGDHTRAFKYVDFPFVRGADGTQVLKPKAGIDPLFFYYACRAIELPSRGYNRHFKTLREQEIPTPALQEQRSIAQALRQIDDALSIQDKQLQTSLALKRAAMHTLFTRGLRGEAQKETEIGPLPESWEVTAIDDVAVTTQYGLSVRGRTSGTYPILRMNCQEDGKVHYRNLQFVDLEFGELWNRFRLRPGDLLFNRTNSIDLVGRMAIIEDDRPAVFASYLVRLVVDADRCIPEFLNCFMNWPRTQR